MAWESLPPTPPARGWSVTVAANLPPNTTGWWWVDEINVLAYFTGSGQLSALAYAIVPAGANLSGAGALSAAAYAIVPAAAVLSGVGALSAGAYAVVPAAVVLSGVGTLSAAAFQRYLAAANLSGSGALTAAAIQQFQTAANLAGVGALSANAAIGYPAVLSGMGALTASAFARVPAAANFSGSGALSVAAALTSVNRSDNFNYSAALATQLPSFWKALAGTPTANGTQFTAPASRTDAAGTVFEVATDRFRIDCVLGTRNTGKAGIIICADANFTKFAYLEIETGTFTNVFHIVTMTSGVVSASNFSYNATGYTRQNNTNQSVTAGNTASISYDIATNTYTTYYNNTVVGTWVDSGNLIAHGAGHRYGGLIVDSEATSNTGQWFDSFNIFDN